VKEIAKQQSLSGQEGWLAPATHWMRINRRLIRSSVIILLLVAGAGPSAQTAADVPRVFLINARKLVETKQRVHEGDKTVDAALAKLESDARKALSQEPTSVISKATTPPSSDKHDYMSQAPYFWPDPAKLAGYLTLPRRRA
jgi:hypothetical protein